MANRKITYEVGFTSDTSQLQAALKQAVASLKELGTNPQNLQRGLEGAAHAALELTNHLRNAYNADTGKLDLTRFRQELDKSGKSLEDYVKELRALGPAGEQAFMQVATAIGTAELPLKRSNQLLNQLWVTMKNTARWRLTTGALNSFIGGLQQAFGYSKSLDASLNDIRIVTNKSADEMARFAKEANQAAKELSTTTTTYTDASLIYYQQGLDDQAVKDRTDATIKMANVTGQSAETISSQMTAVWNNFREGSRTLESYADTMVALGASTASSSKEIAEGLEKFAPIANSVGLSFDYASAALATLVATTRESASVAGNALKTLFSRLEGLKLGETLEDGTDLNKYSQALYTVGINIKDANGELKDMDVILTELGDRWKDLARDEQMALAQTVGGVRQYAQLVALMDNWQVFQQNLTTARTAEGSLEKQAQIYAESWEASRDRVKAATEDIYDSLINPKVFMDLDKMSQAVLKPLASILDGVGGLTGLLPIAAALMTKVYSAQIANVMRDMAVNIGLMTGREQERARAIQAESAALVERLGLTLEEGTADSQRMTVLKEQVLLQGEINAKADQYTESQKAWIENGLYSVNLLKQQVLTQIEAGEKAKENFEEIKNNLSIDFQIPKGFNQFNVAFDHFQDKINNFSNETQRALNAAFQAMENNNAQKAFFEISDALEQIASKSAKINVLQNLIKNVNLDSEAWKLSVKTLAQELGILSEQDDVTADSIDKINVELLKTGGLADQTKTEFDGVIAILKELGGEELAKPIQLYVAYLDTMAKKGETAKLSLSQFIAEMKKIEKGPPPATMDWADTFVAVANGASRAAMAIRSFENVLEVLQDDTLSKSEKFTRVLTSLGMILPTIIPMFSMLGKSALKAGADVATGATVAGTGVAAGVTAAKAAMPIAMALTIVIYGIIKAIDAFNNRQKNAQEEIKKTLDSFNEAKQELESLSDEISTTQDRIKELQDLAASGSISIVEQKELKDLQIENDRLERQLELKKELARIKFTETRTQYQQSGGRAYIVPENDSQTKNYNDIWQTLPVFGENQLSFDEKQGLVNLLASGASLEDAKGYLSAAGLNDYYETLVSVYDQIETIREKNDAEWLNNVGETLSQAETLYEVFLDNVEDFSDADLRKLQGQLADLRKAFYGDQYGEKFVDPVLGDIVKEDLNKLKGIYESTNLIEKAFAYQALSQETKDLFAQYGIDAEDVGKKFSETFRKAQEELNKIGLGGIIDSFGYQELDLIAKFEFQKDSEFTEIQQFFNFLRENTGIVPISFQVQTIEDTRTEALTALASGELLSDEMIAKLQEVYTGFKDIANFNDLSVKDQIEFLTNEGKVAKEELSALQTRRDNLRQDIQDLQYYYDKTLTNDIRRANAVYHEALNKNPYSEETSKAKEKWIDLNKLINPVSIELELKKSTLEEVESEVEALKKQIEKEPWQLNIELGNEIAAELNNAKKAIALINDDLTVSAENLVELGKRYPEILEKAWYDESQNVLKINQNTYDQLRVLIDETLDHDRQANRDAAADKLLAQAQLTDGIIKLVTLAEGETRDEKRNTLIQALQNDKDQLANAKSMALQSMLTVVENEAIKRQNYLNTLVEQQAGDKTTTDTMKENARINVENQAEAATEILRIFDDLFQKISNGSKDAFEGNYVSLFNHYTSNYSGQQGVTYQEQYNKNIQDIKNSPDYKLNELALNYTNGLADAIWGFLNEEKTWEEVQQAFYDSPAIFADAGQRLFGENFAKIIETGLDAGAEVFVQQIEDFYGNNDDALAALSEIRNQTIEALARLLESPDSTKDKSSGSGKTDLVKLDKADLDAEEQALEEIEDRYHEITREIERQERVLTKLEHQIDRTYGLDRLKLYEQEIKNLNKLQDDQRTKQARAERYLKDVDTNRLINAFQATGYNDNLSGRLSARGIGFAGSSSYDIENAIKSTGKEITNFEEVERYINQDMNNFMSAYTDFMKQYDEFVQKYEAMTDEEKLLVQAEAEQWKLDYELLQNQFELVEAQQKERLAAIEQYESTLDTINTLAHEIEDTARRIEDAKLNAITYRMDVILDVRDARKQIRDFTKAIAESLGDALTHGLQTASLGWDQAQDEMAMYKEYVQEYNDLKDLLDNANEFTDTTAIIDELKELEGNIIESGERLLEWLDQVENMFVDALSAAADRFSYFTSQLEHNDAILDTIKELYALQGQTYKTEQGFARLQRVSQEHLDTQIAEAKLQREWFEKADAKLQEAQDALDALIAEKGADAEQDVRYDALKKNRDALLEEQRQAQQKMLSYAQQAMETARQMYVDQLERASYELEQSMTDGVGFDLLQEKYDHFIEEQSRYLDPVEESLETAKWYAKLQQDIDKTSNKIQQDKLKSLQKEIDLRRENNTLSQYDLDLLEAKYKVLQASMALEDTRNAKNQLRLVRDSQGNWNYQFTNNPEDIQAKEQQMLAAKQEEYEITKNRTRDLYDQLNTLASEFAEKDKQIRLDMLNGVLTEEEGAARLEELQKYYEERASYLQVEIGVAEKDLNAAAITSATLAANLSDAVYQTSDAAIQAIVDNFKKEHMSEVLTQAAATLGGPGGLQELLTTHIGDFDKAALDIKAAIASIITAPNQDGEYRTFEGLVTAIEEYDPEIKKKLELWINTFAQELNAEGGVSSEFGKLASSLKDMMAGDSDSVASAFEMLAKAADAELNDGDSSVSAAFDKLVSDVKGGNIPSLKEGLGQLKQSGYDNLTGSGGLSSIVSSLTGGFTDGLKTMTVSTESFKKAVEAYIPRADQIFDDYGETIKKVADECGVSLEDLDEAVEEVSESTDIMAETGSDAVDSLWDQLEAIWDAQQGYLDLAEAVWEYIYALQALAAEQVVPTIEKASGVDEYDPTTDWSLKMGEAAKAGDWEAVDIYGEYRERKFDEGGFDRSKAVSTEDLKKSLIEAYKEGNDDLKRELEEVLTGDKYYSDIIPIASAATGMYTGDFDNGRLAILHEKELVLNQEDTKNILDAVQMVRTMQDNLFGSIAEQLDSDGFAAMALLGQRMGGIGLPVAASTDLEQHVTIEHVSFPGVTSSREIEEAFESLVNDAAQWARRRKS